MLIPSGHTLLHLVEVHGPGLVGLVTGLEAMGLPLPAESLLVAAAIYAGSGGHISIVGIVLAAAIGAILGDNLGYLIGRTLGYALLRRWGRHIGLSDDRLALGRYLFRRHGGKVVLFGRFVAVLRTLAALLAGANHMPWRRFLVSNAAGGILWATGYGFGAYWLGDLVARIGGWLAIGLGAAAAVAVVAGVLFFRAHEHRLIEQARRAMPAAR